jgi:hypothetical protein
MGECGMHLYAQALYSEKNKCVSNLNVIIVYYSGTKPFAFPLVFDRSSFRKCEKAEKYFDPPMKFSRYDVPVLNRMMTEFLGT